MNPMNELYLKSCPKAYQLLIDYYISNPNVANNNPRHFYEFFDSHKIFVQVCTSKAETAPDGFYWIYNIKTINKETEEIEDGMFNGRVASDYYYSTDRAKCENFAFREAYAVLEKNCDVKKLRKAKMRKLK